MHRRRRVRSSSWVLAAVLVLGLVAPAVADRGAKKVRQNPGRLGKGFMSDVFVSRDGRHVIKKVKSTLGGVLPLGPAARGRLAARSVKIMDVIRRAGVPVPRAVVPAGHPDMIVQEFAGEGQSLGELRWRSRPRALASAVGNYARAVRAVRRAGMRGTLVDPKLANFKFSPDGRVVSWFDPAGVGGPWHWIVVRSRMLVRRIAGAVARGRAPAAARR